MVRVSWWLIMNFCFNLTICSDVEEIGSSPWRYPRQNSGVKGTCRSLGDHELFVLKDCVLKVLYGPTGT